jgi:hypothetical protein
MESSAADKSVPRAIHSLLSDKRLILREPVVGAVRQPVGI